MPDTPEQIRAQLREVEPILKRLDQVLGSITFDPAVPTNVEAAVRRMSATVDAHMASFLDNPVLGPLAHQLKLQYAELIQNSDASAQEIEPNIFSTCLAKARQRLRWPWLHLYQNHQ